VVIKLEPVVTRHFTVSEIETRELD